MAYNEQMARSNQDNVNTDGIVLYGDDAVLRMDYFNRMISIKGFPIKPESERSDKSVYDYSKGTQLTLSLEDAMYLGWFIKNELLPKTEKGEPCVTGIRTGKVNLFVISNGIKETGKLVPHVALFRELDSNRRPSGSQIIFTFRKTVRVDNYDPVNGAGDLVEDGRSGLIIMQKFFEQCSVLCGASVHAPKYIDRFLEARREGFITSLAGKLGIELSRPMNYTSRSNVPDPWLSENRTPAASNSTSADLNAPVSTSNTLDDFDGLL